jgi:hypothetical protein
MPPSKVALRHAVNKGMKIAESSITLQSQHASIEHKTVNESLRLWTGNTRPDFEGQARGRPQPAAIVNISEVARTAQKEEAAAVENSAEQAENDPKVQLILRMVEAMTGQKIRLLRAEELQPDQATTQRLEQAKQAGPTALQQRAGWGMEYDYQETRFEAEQTTFNAQGVIKTIDGKEFSFSLDLAMSRQYYEETSVSLRAGDAVRKDPLVINFDGTAAQLTDTRFAFDIDSDGTLDQIAFVAPGSGFLALDKNQNGNIDNGGELFGTQNGNGFADLESYDSDGNHWIDENDAVYTELRIWTRDEAGQGSLTTLAQNDVGALYLGNVATPFSIRDGSNSELGLIRSSGIYLRENGSAGTLQQVDLVV